MKHKITMDAVRAAKPLTSRVRDYVLSLKPDEAVPTADLIKDFGISRRHLCDILRDMKARMTLLIAGEATVCAVHPNTAEKHNAK